MKNKPFDLQKALAGEPVVTKDGNPATYRFTAKNTTIKHTHVFTRTDANGNEWAVIVDDEGRPSNASSLIVKNAELFMAPVKKTVWVNTYNSSIMGNIELGCTTPYNSEEEAKQAWGYNSSDYIGTYPIEIEL